MGKIAIYTILAAWAVIAAACAGHDQAATSRGPAPHVASQKSSAELALTLRREADDLRENAVHHEREAALLSERGGDTALIRENRELAQRLWREADEKEQQAVAIGRQVPHNMVQ